MNYVLCDGGLSNRLNSLIFALILKRKFGHDWEISWPENDWCGAKFGSLFSTPLNCDNSSIQDYKSRQAGHILLMHENQIGFDADRLILNRTLSSYEDYRLLLDGAQKNGDSVVYFNSLLPPFVAVEDVSDALVLLSLNQDVSNAALRFVSEHHVDLTTVGLHIRKTDFGDAVDDDALFQQAASSSSRFFVCSDNEAVNQRFAALKNCCVFAKADFPEKRMPGGDWKQMVVDADGRNYPYNITRGSASVVNGLVDLLILSQTTMLHTSGSTFLAMARLFQSCGYLKPGVVTPPAVDQLPLGPEHRTVPDYVEYRFAYKGKALKMVGRKQVDSDRAIINMIFQREMFAMGAWAQAKALTKYFTTHVEKGLQPLMIDAGANIGAASLYFNQIYPGMRTLAIEPADDNVQLARHNLAGLDAQVVHAALGKDVGVMYINDVDFSPIAYRVGEAGNKPVESCTVPSLVSSLGNGCLPFILKIDIEGGEDIVFSKEAPWLDLFPVVIIELHDWMLPFQCSSKNFFKNIANYDFDILNQGENTFCFNRRLLMAASV